MRLSNLEESSGNASIAQHIGGMLNATVSLGEIDLVYEAPGTDPVALPKKLQEWKG
jgi:hypothetical protein